MRSINNTHTHTQPSRANHNITIVADRNKTELDGVLFNFGYDERAGPFVSGAHTELFPTGASRRARKLINSAEHFDACTFTAMPNESEIVANP